MNEPVKYRLGHTDTYKDGMLMNLSLNGALLWLPDKIDIDCLLEIQREIYAGTQHVYMRILRSEETNQEGYNGYRCRITMIMSQSV